MPLWLRNWLRKYGPLPLLSLGIAFSWTIAGLMRIGAHGWGPTFDVRPFDAEIQLLLLLFAQWGWAWGLVLQGRRLHRSGERESDDDHRRRYYALFGVLSLFVFILAALLLVASEANDVRGTILSYFFQGCVLLVCVPFEIALVSEVVHDDPVKLFAYIIGWLNPENPS